MSTESNNEVFELDDFFMADRIKDFDIIIDGKAFNMENIIKDPSILDGTSAEVTKEGYEFGTKTFCVNNVTNVGRIDNDYKDWQTLFDDVWYLPEDERYFVGNSEDGFAGFYQPRSKYLHGTIKNKNKGHYIFLLICILKLFGLLISSKILRNAL